MRLFFQTVRACLLGLTLLIPGLPRPACSSGSEAAVLIMTHGGSRAWVKSVKKAVKAAQLPYPYRIFFGMGDNSVEQRDLQDMIYDLESDGAHTIYIVPLLVSSYSEVYRQWKYLLGTDVQPGFMTNPLFPVQLHSSIRFADPLNDSAVVVEILLDRAHELSSDASKESVIIVTRGPSDNSDNARWIQILQSLSARIKERGMYASVEAVTLRDDAPAITRQKALEFLRQRVKAADQAGTRALVITHLLSTGGLEHKLALELRGLNYAFNTKALLPDSRISEWLRSQVP